jgi:hypothetical protein
VLEIYAMMVSTQRRSKLKLSLKVVVHHRYPHACAIQSALPRETKGTGNDVAWQSKALPYLWR